MQDGSEEGMTHREQIAACGDMLDKLVDRWEQEFDLPAASIIGMLSFKHWSYCNRFNEAFKDGNLYNPEEDPEE